MERGLIFSLWIQASKDPVALRLALEALGSGQATALTSGGKVMVSASVAGKSFSYQVPAGMSPATLAQMALGAWRSVKDLTTSEQVEDLLTLSTGGVSFPQYPAEPF